MKKIIFVFLLLITSNVLISQNLDSLYLKFTGQSIKTDKSENYLSQSTHHEKCGFITTAMVYENLDLFTKAQQKVITSILTPSLMQTSMVSPSGFFRIHYDETGINKPTYNLDEFAKALDSSYNYEVNVLGYPAPPTSASILNEDKYDVYIKGQINYYGQTVPVNNLGASKCDTYIEIHNSFKGFYTEGIDAAKVTVAHEFHHAIQMGNYIYRGSDSFYYEITSTSMEDFVYDEIDDYVNYLRNYFRHTEKSFSETYGNGYDLTIWNLYLTQKYGSTVGFNIIKRSWELMRTQSAVRAVANAVEENVEDSFKNVFNDFGLWCYFTGSRTKPNEYFKDAANYPTVNYLVKTDFEPPSKSLMVASEPVSNNFLLFVDNSGGSIDSIYSIITNCDIISGANNPSSTLEFDYTLQSLPANNARTIVKDKYYSILESSYIDMFVESNIYNNEPTGENGIEKKDIDYSYPQPFVLDKHQYVKIPVVLNDFGLAELKIYSVSFDLIYSENANILNVEHPYVKWKGLDNNKNKVASGVYIYVTNSEDNIKKGKIVILNE